MSLKQSSAFQVGKAQILAQHEELRREMRTAVVLAGAAFRGNRPCINELPNLVETLIARFAEHLAFEERTLVPMLRAGDSSDRTHGARMTKEHEQQRKELQVLLKLVRSDCDPHTLASSCQKLLNTLIVDMQAEEHWLSEVGGDGRLNRKAG
jgi:iron-sulfur cluster repair protein YtfE (RIC family)